MLSNGKLVNRRGSQILIFPPEIRFETQNIRLARRGNSVLIEPVPDKPLSPRDTARHVR